MQDAEAVAADKDQETKEEESKEKGKAESKRESKRAAKRTPSEADAVHSSPQEKVEREDKNSKPQADFKEKSTDKPSDGTPLPKRRRWRSSSDQKKPTEEDAKLIDAGTLEVRTD